MTVFFAVSTSVYIYMCVRTYNNYVRYIVAMRPGTCVGFGNLDSCCE